MPADPFPTLELADSPTVVAPDGSTVRVLLAGSGGSMARFELEAGRTSRAVRHRTVEELWYVLSGTGEMWRQRDVDEAITPLRPGTCLLISPGVTFQFRATGEAPLIVLGSTMPPWPGSDEADRVEGRPSW